MKFDKKTVYIAGPYTKGDVTVNVRNAIMVGDTLAHEGLIPYIPHLTHFWHILHPKPREFWLELDNYFLRFCDCLFRMQGESIGASNEVALAKALGIPVFYDLGELIGAAKG